MAVYKTVPVDLPGSEELAELRGIIEDLKWVEDICSRLLALFQGPQTDNVLLEALSTAALVRYFRCFSSGVRPKLPQEIVDQLPDEWAKIHQYYKAIRDKHVAHSVNVFEENMITIVVPETDSSGFKVEGLGFSHQRLSSVGPPDAQNLRSLSEIVRTALEEVGEIESEELLRKVQEVPIKEWVAKDLIAMRSHQPGDESKRRDQGLRTRRSSRGKHGKGVSTP